MKIVALFAAAAAAAFVVAYQPPPALSAGPEFCREYANAAERQSKRVRIPRCVGAAEANPRRWTLDWKAHYEWCRGVPPAEANGERRARRIHLEACHH